MTRQSSAYVCPAHDNDRNTVFAARIVAASGAIQSSSTTSGRPSASVR
jgi:hypothetical protein